MIERPEGQWHPGVIELYRLVLKHGWKVERCDRMTKAEYADWPEWCAVFEIELVNPVILKSEGNIITFHEPCFSFPHLELNCLRNERIVIQNGLKPREVELDGPPAVMVQHVIDHLSGKIFHDRKIKLALVREGGKIKPRDFCPCSSKKRFAYCCMKT